MVRVVHLITDLDVGGAELMLARLLETPQLRRMENVVISVRGDGPIRDRIERAGIPVFALDMTRVAHTPAAIRRFGGLLRRLRPQLIQTWLYHADLMGLFGGAVARVPVVWNIRCAEFDPRDHSRSFMMVLKVLARCSRRPEAVIVNSNAGRTAHEAIGYRPRRWELIPNGFDTDAFKPNPEAAVALRSELGLRRDVRLVGMLARFHPMKDHETFVRAAATVAHHSADVHFVAAGRGVPQAPAIEALISSLQLRSRMHLLPERHDAPFFLSGLDVAISSSYSEGFPNVVGEAMACGTLCVATRVGDTELVVGSAGRLVPARDPSALADGILSLLSLDTQARETLSRRARARIETMFSLASVAAQYERLYDDVLQLRPSSSSAAPPALMRHHQRTERS